MGEKSSDCYSIIAKNLQIRMIKQTRGKNYPDHIVSFATVLIKQTKQIMIRINQQMKTL